MLGALKKSRSLRSVLTKGKPKAKGSLVGAMRSKLSAAAAGRAPPKVAPAAKARPAGGAVRGRSGAVKQRLR